MTTATDTGVPTQAELLYLIIDIGDQPTLEDYGRNVTALLTLARYATGITPSRITTPSPPGSRLPPAEVRIVRTSLASPWVSILGDLARSSAPIAYGVTALYALHRLLELVVTWQRHRQDIAERDLQLRKLRDQLFIEHHKQMFEHRKHPLFEVDTSTVTHPQLTPEQLERFGEWPDPDMEAARYAVTQREAPPAPPSHEETVIQAAQDLGKIQQVELISPDDPRATGGATT